MNETQYFTKCFGNDTFKKNISKRQKCQRGDMLHLAL